MIAWLQQNWGSVLVVAVVAVIVAAVIACSIRAKKQGRSSCGCGCDSCAARGACHSQKKK
jgi:hypothetical protein